MSTSDGGIAAGTGAARCGIRRPSWSRHTSWYVARGSAWSPQLLPIGASNGIKPSPSVEGWVAYFAIRLRLLIRLYTEKKLRCHSMQARKHKGLGRIWQGRQSAGRDQPIRAPPSPSVEAATVERSPSLMGGIIFGTSRTGLRCAGSSHVAYAEVET
jgi:hypothetical protein